MSNVIEATFGRTTPAELGARLARVIDDLEAIRDGIALAEARGRVEKDGLFSITAGNVVGRLRLIETRLEGIGSFDQLTELEGHRIVEAVDKLEEFLPRLEQVAREVAAANA